MKLLLDTFCFKGSLLDVADHKNLRFKQVKIVFFVLEMICHLNNGPFKLAINR